MRVSAKKVAAILLAVLLACTLCFGVLAEAGDPYGDYPVYLCMGDSIAAGYGPYGDEFYLCKGLTRVEVAYHAEVADALGAELIPLGYAGFSTQELCVMLDDDFVPADPFLFWLAELDEEEIGEKKQLYRQELPRADLITLNVGSNDVLSHSVLYALYADDREVFDCQTLKVLQALAGKTDRDTLLKKMLDSAEQLGTTKVLMKNIAAGIRDGMEQFSKSFDYLVGKIYEMNPDVTLVVVGMYNPMSRAILTDSLSFLDLGPLIGVVAQYQNRYMRSRSPYAERYLFVDVMGTETFTVSPLMATMDKGEDAIIEEVVPYVHPTLKGQKYMAQKILTALAAHEAEKRG